MARKDYEDGIGTCQACMGEFKVSGGIMVLHGYRRPGHGQVVGQCAGAGVAPYEYDCELTKLIAAEAREDEAKALDAIAALKAGKIVSLTKHDRRYENGKPVTVSTVIGTDHPDWGHVSDIWMANRENDAIHARRFAEFMEARVRTWDRKPIIGIDTAPTGKKRVLREAFDPTVDPMVVAAVKVQRAARAAKPGKLKLFVFREMPCRSDFGGDDDAFEVAHRTFDSETYPLMVKSAKAWAAKHFPAPDGGKKPAVRQEAYFVRDGDLKGALSVTIDWSYQEMLASILPPECPREIQENGKVVNIYIYLNAHPDFLETFCVRSGDGHAPG